jgi:hypothetical protein
MAYLAAIGAVRVKPLGFPLFVNHAVAALGEARAAPGCIWAGTHAQRGYAFSLSVWNSPADMKRYARSRLHARAMRWAWMTAEVTRFCHFPVGAVPSWDEAIAQWDAMMELA